MLAVPAGAHCASSAGNSEAGLKLEDNGVLAKPTKGFPVSEG